MNRSEFLATYLYPAEEERKEYQKLLIEKRTLRRGELEAICICRHRGYIFSSMDNATLRFAEENHIETLELHSILRSLSVVVKLNVPTHV
jgi:hypothetical protein